MNFLNKIAYHSCMAICLIIFGFVLAGCLLLAFVILAADISKSVQLILVILEVFVVLAGMGYIIDEHFHNIENYFKKVCRVIS